MNLKGTLPVLVLRVLGGGPQYGYRIACEIKAKSSGVLDFQEGTLYPALHKLEHEGHVVSYEKTENGRTRRYYRLTRSGHEALAKEREAWQALSGAVTLVLGEA